MAEPIIEEFGGRVPENEAWSVVPLRPPPPPTHTLLPFFHSFLLFVRNGNKEAVPLVEFMYLVFTRMSGDSYRTAGDSGLCRCVCVTYFER